MAGIRFISKIQSLQRQIPGIRKKIPGIIKIEGLQFIADNFKHEGFEYRKGNYIRWPNRKNKKNKKKLIGEKHGGSLKRSWQSTTTSKTASFTSALPYSAVHNQGLMAGRPPGFKMNKSEMIGDSPALIQRIENKVGGIADALLKK